MFLFLLLSCTEPIEEVEPKADTGFGPESPELDAATLEERTQAALELGLPSPIRARNLYESFLTQRENNCPSMENQSSGTWQGVWFDDCTTNGGYHFWGTALFFEDKEETWSIEAMASFELTDPEGYTFIGGGEYELDWVPNQSWFFRIGGTFHYVPYGGWFAQRAETSLFLNAVWENGNMDAVLNGGAGYENIEIYFNHVRLADSVCNGLPQGEILIRDTSTYWFSLTLADCSPCGEPEWRGRRFESICIGEEIQNAVSTLRAEVESE
ncbi:MAG: hypothetical protein VX278_12985 [Myxococcota bacterium]|nr:hypothetical protein [Myxococcota bacterium]